MLHYGNLNDVEFEDLCRDVMSRKLGVSLRSFARGRDGGVDLTDDTVSKNIVVQVKHYQDSDKSALIRSLKKELPKVQALGPRTYYICCSKELTCANIAELREHFSAFMPSDGHIITLKEIDSFLNAPENRDILQKHFKLWIESTGILEEIFCNPLFADCEVLLSDIEEETRLFVRTSAFDRALHCLEQNRALCIVGNPGVGKSITSRMLVLHYAAQGYRVRYTTDVTDLSRLKQALYQDPNTREIILLDDCFGQAYFEMKSSQSTELLSLIKYVKMRTGKVLILNSRVTIFQEARQQQQELVRSLEKGAYQVFVLDMDRLHPVEKARILYNHLAFSGLPAPYFENIKQDRRYARIIAHPNYNPRIIEFVCSPSRWKDVPADQFHDFIRKHLDNPQEMWRDEYERKLQPADRILLQTIYSLTTTTVSLDLAKQCFERRIAAHPGIDKTVKQFEASLLRLTEGFVSNEIRRSGTCLKMANPSVNDFLDGYLAESPSVKKEMVDSICAVVQAKRLLPKDQCAPYFTSLLETGKIDDFVFASANAKNHFIIDTLLSEGLCMERYRTFIRTTLSSISGVAGLSYIDRMARIFHVMTPQLWDFYQLGSYFYTPGRVNHMLTDLELESMVRTVRDMDPYFQDEHRPSYVEQVTECIDNAIGWFCDYDVSGFDPGFVKDAMERTAFMIDGETYTDEDMAAVLLTEDFEAMAHDELEELLTQLPPSFHAFADRIDEYDIQVSGVDELIKEYRLSQYRRLRNQQKMPPSVTIDDIFQR